MFYKEQEQKKTNVPEPPEPEVSIRTMDSDIKSLEQSGGQLPVGEIINSPAIKREEENEESAFSEIGAPGYTGPEKAIFEETMAAQQAGGNETQGINKIKLAVIVAGILVIAAIFGILGYYVISPWLFPKQMPAVNGN
ncbi:hypothetical protein HY227_00220 [Candidatus Wolfebacteria bacterium]|nr:hypothetical protein [Candidatus Wolfebacteria bacterium]